MSTNFFLKYLLPANKKLLYPKISIFLEIPIPLAIAMDVLKLEKLPGP